MIDPAADQFFALLQHLYKITAHSGDFFQRRLHPGFGVEILGIGAKLGQIIGHLAHILGDGHFIVIEDNDQVVQCADVVHALIDHAAGKGAVADDGNHLAGFPLYFFGTGYTDGRGQGGTPMPGNECITLAFLGRRKA